MTPILYDHFRSTYSQSSFFFSVFCFVFNFRLHLAAYLLSAILKYLLPDVPFTVINIIIWFLHDSFWLQSLWICRHVFRWTWRLFWIQITWCRSSESVRQRIGSNLLFLLSFRFTNIMISNGLVAFDRHLVSLRSPFERSVTFSTGSVVQIGPSLFTGSLLVGVGSTADNGTLFFYSGSARTLLLDTLVRFGSYAYRTTWTRKSNFKCSTWIGAASAPTSCT